MNTDEFFGPRFRIGLDHPVEGLFDLLQTIARKAELRDDKTAFLIRVDFN